MLYRDNFTNEFTENDHELQRTERKMTISWSFSYNSLVNSMEKNSEQQHEVLYRNPCFNQACYKGTAMYLCTC